MIEIGVQRRGAVYHSFSDEDAEKGKEYPENMMLKAKVTGMSAVRSRSYRELCCYMGSCRYIASLNLSEDTNTKKKVDHLTRIQQGFVEDTVYDPQTKRIHWIVKSLNYATCDQPASHRFIAGALEKHADLAGVEGEGEKLAVEKYVEFLNELGNK